MLKNRVNLLFETRCNWCTKYFHLPTGDKILLRKRIDYFDENNGEILPCV